MRSIGHFSRDSGQQLRAECTAERVKKTLWYIYPMSHIMSLFLLCVVLGTLLIFLTKVKGESWNSYKTSLLLYPPLRSTQQYPCQGSMQWAAPMMWNLRWAWSSSRPTAQGRCFPRNAFVPSVETDPLVTRHLPYNSYVLCLAFEFRPNSVNDSKAVRSFKISASKQIGIPLVLLLRLFSFFLPTCSR